MTRCRPPSIVSAALLLTLTFTTPAMADFRLQADVQVPAPPVPARDSDRGQPDKMVRTPVSNHFRTARGFGQEVPLDFAVRQIVPATMLVRFGKGVDPTSVVTWKGDAAWNRVLASAVRPLGLLVITGTTTVLITR